MLVGFDRETCQSVVLKGMQTPNLASIEGPYRYLNRWVTEALGTQQLPRTLPIS